jgi:hypothetical protein
LPKNEAMLRWWSCSRWLVLEYVYVVQSNGSAHATRSCRQFVAHVDDVQAPKLREEAQRKSKEEHDKKQVIDHWLRRQISSIYVHHRFFRPCYRAFRFGSICLVLTGSSRKLLIALLS